MKKQAIILLIVLLLPAAGVLAQMEWHDKDMGEDVFIYKGKGPGMGHGMDCDKGFGPGHGKGMGMGMDMGEGGGCGVMAMAEKLELTDDQIEKIKKLKLEHQLAMVDSRAAVRKAEISLKALMCGDNADQSKVFAAIDKLAALKADIKKATWKHRQQVKSILTDEQREKMKSQKCMSGGSMMFGGPGEHGKRKGFAR